MSSAKITAEQQEELYQEFLQRMEADNARKNEMFNRSVFQYGGKLTKCDLSKPNQRFRDIKDASGAVVGREPILDEMGQPTFWDNVYYAELSHIGSSRKFSVSVELGKDLQIGTDYLFEGEFSDDGKLKVKLITKI